MVTVASNQPVGHHSGSGGEPPQPTIPVVLTIGDMESTESAFGRWAWEEIRGAALEEHPDAAVLGILAREPPPFGMQEPAGARYHELAMELPRIQEACERPRERWPIPIPLSHGSARQALSREFTQSLIDHLVEFDVVAIIACGPAAQSGALLTHLNGLRVPLFATVDSTVASSSGRDWVRHIMPNNDLQAQAIVARLLGLQGHADSVTLYCHPQPDPYVSDLSDAITRQMAAARLNPPQQTRVPANIDAHEDSGIVICVGYPEALGHLLKAQRCGRDLIMSDGCFRKQSVSLLRDIPSPTRFHWARPATPPEIFAHDAYRCVHDTFGQFQERTDPARRSDSFAAAVAERLEHFDHNLYGFDGYVNTKGGYIVDRLYRREHHDWAETLSSPRRIPPPEKRGGER